MLKNVLRFEYTDFGCIKGYQNMLHSLLDALFITSSASVYFASGASVKFLIRYLKRLKVNYSHFVITIINWYIHRDTRTCNEVHV